MKIIDKNYTCQVVNLPQLQTVEGLDNLVQVNIYGNNCLIGKDSKPGLYLFFPAECVIHHRFLSQNNIYRHSNLNVDPLQKGFFEDTGRVKAVKFKGVISTGFLTPVENLYHITGDLGLRAGDEFNEIAGILLCKKYVVRRQYSNGMGTPKPRIIDQIVDSRMAPEHFDTEHLMKNTHKIKYEDNITVSVKLHGTSARFYNTLVRRRLTWKDKIAKWFGVEVAEEKYDYVTASRRVIKSVGFEQLPNKNHYYVSGDLWSEVGKNFEGKLFKGEAVYCEIVGKTYQGEAIQSGYTYGFQEPKVFIYRISNINPEGVETDLSAEAVAIRANQLGFDSVPVVYSGTLQEFISEKTKETNFDDRDKSRHLEQIFYDQMLEKPSMFDKTVVEEGFCVRVESYPRPQIFKIKSRKFLENETKMLDKGETNLEDEQANTD